MATTGSAAMSDVTITLACDGRTVTISAMSYAQARAKFGAAWLELFSQWPQAEAAGLEVIMTEIAESFGGKPCAS